MNRLDGRIAVVTGGTQGLGAAVARQFAQAGAAGIVICGRNQAKGSAMADAIASETGVRTLYQPADLEQVAEARALAMKLANGPTIAYAQMKRNIATAMDNNLQLVLLAEAEAQRVAGASNDAMEGGMAFLQKRKPEFKGQ